MELSDFDFDLPADRIALRPAVPRDAARMLVVRPDQPQRFTDCHVTNLVDLIQAGDVLVVNNTKVIPAALTGIRRRGDAEARISVNLLEREGPESWTAFVKPLKRLKMGEAIVFGDGNQTLAAELLERHEYGRVLLQFNRSGSELDRALEAFGSMPLPPYIAGKRRADDSDDSDYQTYFARESGAVAAPTAGLHFTEDLLSALNSKGVRIAEVTLHIGAGTFLPVKADKIDDHVMHSEFGIVDSSTADLLNRKKREGGRIIAVGTTSLRLLESAARADGTIEPFHGDTDIFIKPGFRFKAVDALMTNFHLPCSTLFMLVCALSGVDCMKMAYQHAIDSGYRFYSYGDASLLFPDRAV